MTPEGFYSAVQHDTDPDLLVVRTRVKADAEHLRKWYVGWKGRRPGLPKAKLTTYAYSDYPWRVILPRQAWADFLLRQVDGTTYGNFKDRVAAVQGKDRARVYGRVWADLLELEDADPDGRARAAW